jgi:hypothetical protein
MKGQIFIMVAVLVLISLILIRSGTKPFVIKPKSLLFEDFLNLKNELITTVDISLLRQEDISNNLDNFISFSTDILEQRGYETSVNYSVSISGSLTTVYMNVSLELGDSYLKDNLIIERTVYT